MTALHFAPLNPVVTTGRQAFTAPTGTYYMLGTPSVILATELVECGLRRVVLSIRQEREDWPQAEEILLSGGVEVSATYFAESD